MESAFVVYSKWRIVSCILILSMLLSVLPINKSYAISGSSEYFQAPNDEINAEAFADDGGIVDISTADLESIESLIAWLSKQETYVMVKEQGGDVSYYFNTPNLQKSILNQLQELNDGGFVFNEKRDWSEEDPDKWTTAEKKYGWNFPTSYYVGEYPATQLKAEEIVKGMANPINAAKIVFTNVVNWGTGLLNNIVNFFTGIFDIQIDGFTVEADLANSRPEDLKGIKYSNSDYVDSTQNDFKAIAQWLQDNWYFMESRRDIFDSTFGGDKSIFEKGNIVYDDEVVGSGEGEINGETLLNRIINKAGNSYTYLIDKLVTIANDEEALAGDEPRGRIRYTVYRHMPYDLSSMSKASAEYMNNIADPRVVMFTKNGDSSVMYLTTTLNSSKHVIDNAMIGITSSLLMVASLLNDFCSMNFIKESPEIDLFFLWKGAVGEFIVLILGVAIVVMVVRCALGRMGTKGNSVTLSQTLTTLFMIFILGGIMLAPAAFGDFIVDTTSKVINFGTSFTSEDENSYKRLYTSDASESEKTSMRYWSLAFNAWCDYSTNHSFKDDASKFEIDKFDKEHENEYVLNYKSNAKLKDNRGINNWAVILLQSEFDNSLDVYRVVDHYMAPKIIEEDFPSFKVERNPYYNGFMYESVSFGYILIALSVLALNLLKVICFVELLYTIMMLLIKLAIGALSGVSQMKGVFKELGFCMLRIIAYEIFITVVLHISMEVNGKEEVIAYLGFIFLAATVFLWYKIVRNNNMILAPECFKAINTAASRGRGVINGFKNNNRKEDRDLRKSIKKGIDDNKAERKRGLRHVFFK